MEYDIDGISIERPYQQEGAPPCGIYLVAPSKWPVRQAQVQLKRVFAALNSSQYRRNMHAVEFSFPAKIQEKERSDAITFVNLCKANGIVPIIRNHLGLVVECGAEGLIVEKMEHIAPARHVLGDNFIIGMDCKNSKEMAAAALEAGADYVSFGRFFSSPKLSSIAPMSLLNWWARNTHLPAVAHGNITPANTIELVRQGASFIGAKTWVWNHKLGPAQAIYMIQECINYVYNNPSTQH